MGQSITLSINLDDNFQNILSDGEKTKVYLTLVYMGRNLFLDKSFLRKSYQYEEDFQDTGTNKKILVSKYLDTCTFMNF